MQEQTEQLQNNLHNHANQLSVKENEVCKLNKELDSLRICLKKTQEEQHLQVKKLEIKLAEQKDRSGEISQELEASKSRIAVYEERIKNLQDNLHDTIQTSKQSESKSRAEHMNNMNNIKAVYEAKLENAEQSAEKAERREEQATALLKEARQETSALHKIMQDRIQGIVKEASQAHRAEMEKMTHQHSSEVEKLVDLHNTEREKLNNELKQAKDTLAKERENHSRTLSDVESRIKDLSSTEAKLTDECDKLQTQLKEVSIYKYNISLFIVPDILELLVLILYTPKVK